MGEAGGLGFLAAGYKTPDAVAEDIAALRAATRRAVRRQPLLPGADVASADAVAAYARTLAGEAERHGVVAG